VFVPAGTCVGTMSAMPALNIEFDPEELELLREAAAREQVSLKRFARDAVLSAATHRKVAEVARGVAERSAELNERLAR